jgi:hypothetical protein
MKEIKTEQGNKIISGFMQVKWHPVEDTHSRERGRVYMDIFNTIEECMAMCKKINKHKTKKDFIAYPFPCKGNVFSIELEYHSSFDSIIPVIRKFRNLDLQLPGYKEWVLELDHAMLDDYDIRQVFPTVVKAIQWYNSNKK